LHHGGTLLWLADQPQEDSMGLDVILVGGIVAFFFWQTLHT
jgi:hypothetical protein